MAGNTKDYQIVFALRAQLDSSMRQFSTVGQQLKELEEQVQRYNQTLSNIDAYRRQEDATRSLVQQYGEALTRWYEARQAFDQATTARKQAEQAVNAHKDAIADFELKIAAEKTAMKEEEAAMLAAGEAASKVKAIKAEHAATIARLEEAQKREKAALKESEETLRRTTAAEKSANEEANKAQHTRDRLKEKIAQERQKLNELAEALKKAGVDTKNLEEAEKLLNRQLDETTQKQDALTRFANGINTIADRFTALASAAQEANSALEPVMDFFKGSLDAAATLEYGMSAVEAISGATEAEAARMTAVVKEMGATTIFTAKQSADAMQNMALAGWDAEQMISGLPAVIKMAAASGEDLAEVTGIVSDGMNAFQLSGEKAAVMFADVLAKAATSSNTNIGLLGQSLSYVEGTAGNLGYTITDVSLALAAMANNALKGGVSGSALNTMLTRMSGANENAAKQMEKMGLSMYDANGKAKPLLQFLNELREAFKKFGDDSQSAQIAAYNLAGMRGMRGLLAIVGQSDEQWQKLTDDVYNFAGASEQISSIRMDNYTGQMYLLTSAWDALKTSIGEQFLPTATDALGVLTDITNSANEFVQNHGNVVQGIAATTGVLWGVFKAISAIAPVVAALRIALMGIGIVPLLGVLGGIAAAAGIAGIAIASYTSEEAKSRREGIEYAKSLKKTAEEIEKNREEAQKAAEAYQEQRRYAEKLIDGLDDLERAYKNGEITATEMQFKIDELNATMPGLGLTFDKTTGKINKTTEEMRAFNAELREGEQEAKDDYLETLTKTLNDYQSGLAGAIQKREELLRGLKEKYGDKITVNDDYTITVTARGRDARTHNYVTPQELRGVRELNDEIENYNILIAKTTAEKEEEERARRAAAHAEAIELGISEDLLDVYDSTEAALEAVAEAYIEVYTEIEKTYEKQFDLFEMVEEKTASMEEMQEAIESQLAYWTQYRENLEKVRDAAQSAGIDLSSMWSWLASGDKDAAAAVAEMARTVEEDGGEALKKLTDTYEQMLEERSAAAETAAGVWQEKVETQLEEAQKTIMEAVQNSEAYDEALAAMETTFDGYIDGISTGSSRVDAALSAAASRWKAQIANVFTANMPTPRPKTPERTGSGRGFAKGTDFAPRGIALVGEEGPELMFMRGGEKIVPADKTRDMLFEAVDRRERAEQSRVVDFPRVAESVSNYGGDVHIEIHISGDATPETVRRLEEYGEELEQRIRKVMREEGTDARRRAYA